MSSYKHSPILKSIFMVTASIPLMRIFISSPQDAFQERRLANDVIDDLSRDPLLRDRVILRPVAWDRSDSRTPMLATRTPQEAIDEGLTKPSACDIVIVILWKRMGTPLPPTYRKKDGSLYASGTEYEFEDALYAARECQTSPVTPQILVYKRTEQIVFTPD